MSKVRIVYKTNNTIVVIHPVPQSRREKEIDEQWLERVFNKAMQGELRDFPYKDIDSSELPQDREDRNAWEWDDTAKKIKINPIKAQEIRKEKLIREKMLIIQEQEKREIAITELKKEGKL